MKGGKVSNTNQKLTLPTIPMAKTKVNTERKWEDNLRSSSTELRDLKISTSTLNLAKNRPLAAQRFHKIKKSASNVELVPRLVNYSTALPQVSSSAQVLSSL